LIEQETELAADNPAMIRHAFAANLLGTPTFAHGCRPETDGFFTV
jgi:hypothetical protein